MVTALSGVFFRPLPITTLTVRQFLDGKAIRVATLIALIPAVFALIYLIQPAGTRIEFFSTALFLNLFAPTVLPIAVLILATAAFGNELEDRTLPYLTLKPISRLRIVLEKWLAIMVVGIPVVALSQIVTVFILSLSDGNSTEQRYEGTPFASEIPNVTHALWPAIAASAVGVVMFGSIFMLVSLVIQRALLAGIIYAFVWESLLGRYLSGIRIISVKQYVQSIFDRLLDIHGVTVKHAFQLDSALMVMVGTTIVCIALATWRLRRMNLE